MSNPKQKQQWEVKQKMSNLLELPYDVMVDILSRVGVIDILENAQKVCTTWRQICKEPSLWKVVYMDNFLYPFSEMQGMCRQAVDRSQGQLVDITIVEFGDDELLRYVADRSSRLRRLGILGSYFGINQSLNEAMKKFPFLEELNLFAIKISKEAIETAGRCCPMLRTLKLNQITCSSRYQPNEIAIAIAENLVELRHLELIGNSMANSGLQAILKGCRHLETLDLRQCMYIDLKGDMEKKCLAKIKCLKLPTHSLDEWIIGLR